MHILEAAFRAATDVAKGASQRRDLPLDAAFVFWSAAGCSAAIYALTIVVALAVREVLGTGAESVVSTAGAVLGLFIFNLGVVIGLLGLALRVTRPSEKRSREPLAASRPLMAYVRCSPVLASVATAVYVVATS